MNLDLIFKRRSIRAYTSEPVEETQIRGILEAGMAAPSANNRQPWQFVVVTDRDKLKALAHAHPYGKMLAHAAAAIAVCGEPEVSEAYWVQDCSAATQNILLAAAALDLGAVWLGCYPREDRVGSVSKILNIPDRNPVLSLISIGHPAENPPPRTQYKDSKVHRNNW